MSKELKDWIKDNLIGPSGRPNVNKIKFSWFENNYQIKKYNEIINCTYFLDEDCKFSERLYCIIHDIKNKEMCPYCRDKELKFNNLFDGYRDSCIQCLKHQRSNRKEELEKENREIKLIDKEELKHFLLIHIISNGKTKKGRLNKEWFYSNDYHNEYESMFLYTSFLKSDVTLSERLYCIINNFKEPFLCKWCKERVTTYLGYTKGYRDYCSNSCGSLATEDKRIKTNLEKFGFERPFQNYQVVEETRKQWLVNHNGKFPQGLPETNKKRKLTNKERYGDENYNNFEQRLITNEERYGDPYYTNWEKIKKTNNLLYGVDWPLQNKDILKQTQETLFENEGVYHGLCSYTILKRTHQNNSKKISKPQRKLYWIVSRIFKNAQLEYFFEGKFIDIAIPDKMIAIEYDGSYWHEHRKNNDEKRQKYLESFGWKFLRYLDHVPTKEEFLNDIKFIK